MITPACERGSGGSIHRWPFRSRMATTPYDRPPSDAREHCSTRTVEGNGSGWLPKFLEPASRFITRLFSVFRSREKHLVRLDTPMMVSNEQRVDGGHISKNSENVGISDLEQLLSQRRFTRFEAKHLMEAINSRFVETHKSEWKNNNPAKGSFFQEKRTSCRRSYGAKTFDLSLAPKSIVRISEAPKVPRVANKISLPRGRSAMYEMARSPFFNCDPSAKMKRGSEYTWNVGGWPSSSQYISRNNSKPYGKQGSEYTWNVGGWHSFSQYISRSNSKPYGKQGSFFQEKRTSCRRSYGAKTFDLSLAPKSIVRISEAPKVPSVANKISLPRGRSAMYEMARSPFFNCDPSAKMKRGSEYTWNVGGWPSFSRYISRSNSKPYGKQGSEYTWNVGGWPSSSQCISRSNSKPYGKQGSEYTWNVGGWPSSSQCISRGNSKPYGKQILKRAASSLDADNELLGPTCKISKKSTEKCNNEEPKIKNDPPGMHTTFAVDVSDNIDHKNIKESQSIKENKAVDDAQFATVILRSEIIANGMNDATTSAIMANDMNDDATSNGSTRPIIRSTDNDISTDATLPSEKKSYFHMSAPEDISDEDEGSDATCISEASFSTLPTQTKSYFRMSVPEDISDEGEDSDASYISEASFSTLPTQTKSYFRMSVPEDTISSDEE